MSVIVMGMQMPKRCFECPIIDATDGFWCSAADKDLRQEHGINLSKPDWCPLRPLPEKHGRLIDADAFIGTIRPIVEEDDYAGCTFRTVKELMTEHIDEAQTIVEADGE